MIPTKRSTFLLFPRLRRLGWKHVVPDLLLIAFSFYASLYLRVGGRDFAQFLPVLNRQLGVFILLRFGIFIAWGVYDIMWRYISLNDAALLFRAVVTSSVAIIAATYVVDIGRIPRATFFIDTALITVLLAGIRVARRIVFESRLGGSPRKERKLTLIYGAGTNGRILASRMLADQDSGLEPLGFVDDDPQKLNRSVAGIKVLGMGQELGELIRAYRVEEVIVAISKAPGDLLRDIVQVCRGASIRPRLLKSVCSPSDKTKHVEIFQNIGLSDLLRRPRRSMDSTPIKSLVENRRVLITGAGGSIGSELARQIANFRPSKLLLLDHSEYHLYEIDQELRVQPQQSSSVVPILVDIKDKASLKRIFETHAPEIVFHAAAYKHVHLVEGNPLPSILNNVLGTKSLLELCEAFDVGSFVLISTDKAVNPAGVMGATKRVCELMVAAVGERTKRRYCAVRFGNVLGSSGSLIPLLQRQIENGEPVTITHKEMTRYFMLIPEAVSLVLKAATIAQPGDITLLRMGEPIKIVDIAKSLIALMGKTEGEVPILYTGMRPGEKLFEELYLSGAEINTEDPDVLVLPWGNKRILNASGESLFREVEKIIEGAVSGSNDALSRMDRLVKNSSRVGDSEVDLFEDELVDLPTSPWIKQNPLHPVPPPHHLN